jgi:hypothetical protein
MDMTNMWEEQMRIIQDEPTQEEIEAPFGRDYYGTPYTYDDALSSYQDSEYHAQREGEE